MLTRTTLIAVTAAIGLTGAAMADGSKSPTIMDDTILDSVIAGGADVNTYGTPTDTFVARVDDAGFDIQKLRGLLSTAMDNENNVVEDASGVAIKFGGEHGVRLGDFK